MVREPASEQHQVDSVLPADRGRPAAPREGCSPVAAGARERGDRPVELAASLNAAMRANTKRSSARCPVGAMQVCQ